MLSLILLACGAGPRQEADTPKETNDQHEPDHVIDPPEAELNDLLGEWTDVQEDGRTVFHEQWRRTDDHSFTGLGFIMSGTDTVFIEHLGLAWTEGVLVYSARIDSQNDGATVLFTHKPTGPDTLWFENAEHDFPQMIRYVRNATGWTVKVTGAEKGKAREENFQFSPRGSDQSL